MQSHYRGKPSSNCSSFCRQIGPQPKGVLNLNSAQRTCKSKFFKETLSLYDCAALPIIMPGRGSGRQKSILPAIFYLGQMSSELKLFLLLTKFQDPTHTPNCDRPHVSAIYRHIFSGVCKSSNSEKIPKVRQSEKA